jgi:hypothetical protein
MEEQRRIFLPGGEPVGKIGGCVELMKQGACGIT